MTYPEPPRWLSSTLIMLLPERDRETVSGDLHEEYSTSRRPRLGKFAADAWYARQVLSFLPSHAGAMFARARGLSLLCAFTGLCGFWLGVQSLRHRHAGFVVSEAISALIVLQAAITLIALCFRSVMVLRRVAIAGTAALASLAARALIGTLRGNDFEGYILLIALLLLVQTVLTLRFVPEWHRTRVS